MIEYLGLLAIPAAGAIRSTAGWFENAVADGTITRGEWANLLQSFEIEKFLETIIRVSVIAVGVQGTLMAVGTSPEIFASSAAGLLLDVAFKALKQ